MDTNSMHGTWVNGVKLTGGRKTLLETDDILTFGATVSRGAGKLSHGFVVLKYN